MVLKQLRENILDTPLTGFDCEQHPHQPDFRPGGHLCGVYRGEILPRRGGEVPELFYHGAQYDLQLLWRAADLRVYDTAGKYGRADIGGPEAGISAGF